MTGKLLALACATSFVLANVGSRICGEAGPAWFEWSMWLTLTAMLWIATFILVDWAIDGIRRMARRTA